MSVGRVVAIICLLFIVIGGGFAAFFGYAFVGKARESVASLFHKKIDTKQLAQSVSNTVQTQVQGQVQNAANTAIENLQPGTVLSQSGVGDKTITGIKISGSHVLVTGVLAAAPSTQAKLELSESGSGQLVASMSFGTSSTQTTATTAKLFTVIPGTYTVKIQASAAWNVTIVEK